MEKVRLHLMVTIIRLESPNKCGSSFTSSSTKAISAASTAISLPIPPIAIPTFAFFNAGTSFTPSPIMQTDSCFCCSSAIHRILSSGKQFVCTSVICSCEAMAVAAFSWSPVSNTGCTFKSFNCAIIPALSVRTVSESTR